MTEVDTQTELRKREIQRVLALASAVREEYGRPWSALSPLEIAECFVTSMRADGWRNKADTSCDRVPCGLYDVETDPPLQPPLQVCSNPDCDRSIKAHA